MDRIFVDLECIVNHANSAKEKVINTYEPLATSKFLDETCELFLSGAINENDYRTSLDINEDIKNRVLEEVDDKYREKINYFDIYSPKNIGNSSKNYIIPMILINKDIDAEKFIIFYYNETSKWELQAKLAFCEKYFPNIKAIPIKYYEEKYEKNIIRNRTNKAKYIKKVLNLNNLENNLLIDKSTLCSEEWQREDGEVTEYSSIIASLENEDPNYKKKNRIRGI